MVLERLQYWFTKYTAIPQKNPELWPNSGILRPDLHTIFINICSKTAFHSTECTLMGSKRLVSLCWEYIVCPVRLCVLLQVDVIKWPASREKFLKVLSHWHTKRRTSTLGLAHPSFRMTPTFQKTKPKQIKNFPPKNLKSQCNTKRRTGVTPTQAIRDLFVWHSPNTYISWHWSDLLQASKPQKIILHEKKMIHLL